MINASILPSHLSNMSQKLFIIDTNVLMRYLLKDDEKQFLIAQSYFLNESQLLFLPIQTLCEAIWIIQKKSKIERANIVIILEVLFAQKNILIDDDVVNFAMQFFKNGGDFADGVIAYHALLNDNFLITFDKKLQKLCERFNIQHINL